MAYDASRATARFYNAEIQFAIRDLPPGVVPPLDAVRDHLEDVVRLEFDLDDAYGIAGVLSAEEERALVDPPALGAIAIDWDTLRAVDPTATRTSHRLGPVDADLAERVRAVADCNGIDDVKYLNNVVEMGLRADGALPQLGPPHVDPDRMAPALRELVDAVNGSGGVELDARGDQIIAPGLLMASKPLVQAYLHACVALGIPPVLPEVQPEGTRRNASPTGTGDYEVAVYWIDGVGVRRFKEKYRCWATTADAAEKRALDLGATDRTHVWVADITHFTPHQEPPVDA